MNRTDRSVGAFILEVSTETITTVLREVSVTREVKKGRLGRTDRKGKVGFGTEKELQKDPIRPGLNKDEPLENHCGLVCVLRNVTRDYESRTFRSHGLT